MFDNVWVGYVVSFILGSIWTVLLVQTVNMGRHWLSAEINRRRIRDIQEAIDEQRHRISTLKRW